MHHRRAGLVAQHGFDFGRLQSGDPYGIRCVIGNQSACDLVSGGVEDELSKLKAELGAGGEGGAGLLESGEAKP